MTQTITLRTTIETPHTDEPLSATDRATNQADAENAIREALTRAGFTVRSITIEG